MELHVDVTPSSSNGYRPAFDAPYEQVDFREIIFPNFQQMKRLGRGSYGTVIQAVFRGKNVAVKLLDKDLDHTHIHNEAKILAQFKHENIIKLFATFHGENRGLILELMEGGSLHELLHQHRHVQYFACHVVGWSQQVLDALGYLHDLQLVHRDLKPLNMLLTNDFITLKMCDFGTAAELRTSMTNNRGSACFMAPEVFRGKKYNQKCDIFSFGIFLWEMITRRQPFDDFDSHAYTILWQVSEGRRPQDVRGCPTPIMDLIKSCWHDTPQERPTVEQLTFAIEQLCHIYPNRYRPLIDRTTGLQAFAHPIPRHPPAPPQPQQFFNGPYIPSPSPYMSQNNTVQQTTHHQSRSQHVPPIPPPPKIHGHYRTGSHDLTARNTANFYNQPTYSQTSTITTPQGEQVSRTGSGSLVGYNPLVSNPSPIPPAAPYTPTLSRAHLPPQYPSPNLQVPAEINTRRSSEPPIGQNEYAANDGKQTVKKKGRIRGLINGLKKL